MLHFRFRWLLGHIVGEQDDSQAGRFALDQLEFGQVYAVVEKAFSASHDHGMQHQPVLIDEIGLHQRPDEGGTPFDEHLLTRQSPWRLIVANAPIPTVPWSWLMFDFTQLPNALC